jgi:choline dehydrogenase-like flavoprotein
MEGYLHTAGVNILGECLPNPDNRVELTEDRDGRGLPVPRVVFSAGENERRLTTHANEVLTRIITTAGGQDVWRYERYAHVLGTCRMGDVVDAEGRVQDVPNLYISDASVFPSALSVNPALTIMAVSLRTADRFLERAARGDV